MTPWGIARQAPLSMGFSRQEYWSGLPCPPPGDLPNPGIEPRSPALWAASFPAEPPGKPKNTGVGSLSLLQGIFLTQGLNPGLLHCRRILYHLSYPGSPASDPTAYQTTCLQQRHTPKSVHPNPHPRPLRHSTFVGSLLLEECPDSFIWC